MEFGEMEYGYEYTRSFTALYHIFPELLHACRVGLFRHAICPIRFRIVDK